MRTEDRTYETEACCGHPVEIRFMQGTSEAEKAQAIAEVQDALCSFCEEGR